METITVLEITSERPKQALDITSVLASKLPTDAISMVSVPHTTCAIILSENDPELLSDIERTASGLLAGLEPFAHARHNNPNAAAHIMSSMLGTTLLLRTEASQICLGEWQSVIFVELDGPRPRRIEIAPLRNSQS